MNLKLTLEQETELIAQLLQCDDVFETIRTYQQYGQLDKATELFALEHKLNIEHARSDLAKLIFQIKNDNTPGLIMRKA